MSPVIIGGDVATLPLVVQAPIIQTKAVWTEDWATNPELRLERCSVQTAGAGTGEIVIRRDYGKIRFPHTDEVATTPPIDIDGHWVKLLLVGASGPEVSFVGKIYSERRKIDPVSSDVSGAQTWIGYGGKRLLEKRLISTSYWYQDAQVQTLGWMPSFNIRNEQSDLIGNRDDTLEGTAPTQSYLFGGTTLWSRYDMLQYLLARFLNSDASGPTWTIGGQFLPFQDMTEAIEIPRDVNTIESMIRLIIPLELGYDYLIAPTETDNDSGFEIHIFALQLDEISFGDATLPVNPNVVSIDSANSIDITDIDIETTNDHTYREIRIVGQRMVVAFSLFGADASIDETTMVPRWNTALDGSYESAGDREDGRLADIWRARDRWRNTYAIFGAPTDWDFNSGQAAPVIDDGGEIVLASDGNWQNQVRKTLSWLPMREGYAYAGIVPTKQNAANSISADYQPPKAWVFDEDASKYILAEKEGIHVSALANDWGLRLDASPNHVLALNAFDPDVYPTGVAPKFDPERIAMTIAVESDQRLVLTHTVDSAPVDAGTFEVSDPTAALWWISPGTIVEVTSFGNFSMVRAGGMVVRNDAARLHFRMAGLIARYGRKRVRCQLRVKGLLPWATLTGQMLGMVEESGKAHRVASPITGVQWVVGSTGQSSETIITAGFAG